MSICSSLRSVSRVHPSECVSPQALNGHSQVYERHLPNEEKGKFAHRSTSNTSRRTTSRSTSTRSFRSKTSIARWSRNTENSKTTSLITTSHTSLRGSSSGRSIFRSTPTKPRRSSKSTERREPRGRMRTRTSWWTRRSTKRCMASRTNRVSFLTREKGGKAMAFMGEKREIVFQNKS